MILSANTHLANNSIIGDKNPYTVNFDGQRVHLKLPGRLHDAPPVVGNPIKGSSISDTLIEVNIFLNVTCR